MGRVHVIQCLCPRRHCYMAIGYEEGKMTEDAAMALCKEAYEQMLSFGYQPFCAICGARELRFEDEVTRFDTLEEAMPTLEKLQAANLRGAEFFRQNINRN